MSRAKRIWAAALALAAGGTAGAVAGVATAKAKAIAVTLDQDGFSPSHVQVAKGEPTTLVFTRKVEKTCATEVAFPELKLTKALPLNEPVAVEVPSGEARTLTFQCGMGMFKSKVVVE